MNGLRTKVCAAALGAAGFGIGLAGVAAAGPGDYCGSGAQLPPISCDIGAPPMKTEPPAPPGQVASEPATYMPPKPNSTQGPASGAQQPRGGGVHR